jgi:ABC-type Zn uptake system ZnuABC Zn-binding protein ZnuA
MAQAIAEGLARKYPKHEAVFKKNLAPFKFPLTVSAKPLAVIGWRFE